MVLSSSVLAGERGSAPAFPHLPPAAAAVASLEPRECRWPLGEPADEDFAFCGGLRLLRGSYCAVHARLSEAAWARPRNLPRLQEGEKQDGVGRSTPSRSARPGAAGRGGRA